ncbi:hypothetical protein ACQKWADRAFT_210289 [Trichoderma austrokoningii]
MPLHPYKRFRLPKDASFQLKPSPGKGWGAFAKKPISKGDLILSDAPLWIIQKPSLEITEADIWIAFARLTPSQQMKFLLLGDNGAGPFESGLAAMAQNTFQIHVEGSNLPAFGLFPLMSRFNHSCVPNAKIPRAVTESGQQNLEIFATRDIAGGEEITFCYVQGFECRTRLERYQLLLFPCNCEICVLGTNQASDMRRTLIRALKYLTQGADIDGPRPISSLPFSIDPELQRAAEEPTIPLSSRWVYNLLIMVLLEKEGLMNDSTIKEWLPGIRRISEWFVTESNVEIVRLALAQGTWLEKFCVAARLFGREDAADHDVALQIKRMRNSIAEE